MLETLTWWVLIELIGLSVLPIAFRFFRNLPGRGYAFSKPLGLLLIAFPFWLLTSFHFLDNSQGSIALVAILVAAISWGVFGRRATADDRAQTADDRPTTAASPETVPVPANGDEQPESNDGKRRARDRRSERANQAQPSPVVGHAPSVIAAEFMAADIQPLGEQPSAIGRRRSPVIAWLGSNLSLVVAVELVFTIAFFGWALMRAYVPDISGTEKPMEFAFLNGILQSQQFPPLDPWLSGYAISYYYFGYVIVAMLTMLSGVASSIAFNLAIALLFGLAAAGAFGLAYDLIAGNETASRVTSHASRFLFALFAPIFLLIIGNLEGLLEALHARGLGTPQFWNWLDVKGLVDAPVTGTLVPTDNWWWWRASRVIHDVARGQTQEVIDEFPQFSFLLGDMHPHVLALPFVILALAAALNLFRDSRLEHRDWHLKLRSLNFRFPFSPFDLLLLTCIVGALPFLNFWDILPYGFIVVVAFAIARYRAENGWNGAATRDMVVFVVSLGVVSLLLYLPFYIGFQSQAGGILPVLYVKTQLHQYLLMFGIFVFIFAAFLARVVYAQHGVSLRDWLARALPVIVGLVAFPVIVALLALTLLTVSAPLRDSAIAAFGSSENLYSNLLAAYFGPLASDPWLFILLVVLLALIVVALRLRVVDLALPDTSTTFVLLMLLTGFLLTFGVEFVYLRDVFGTRMNTVFKFYFQAWTLFAIGGAYAVYYLARTLRPLVRGGFFAGVAVLLFASLLYPVLGIPNRANDFQGNATLDGTAFIRGVSPGDYAAIQWLDENAPRGAHILESTGRQYTFDDRISMATGLPTVLGWIGHEDQWRGSTKLYKDDATGVDRAADVARIYQTSDANSVLTLVDKYAISFVVVGPTEREQYSLTPMQVDKFDKVMSRVFDNGGTRIYARSR